jgi:DNA topoisomerase I
MTDAQKNLVIVESPAKARTIGKYLGKGYDVAASVGHVRDLPPKELGRRRRARLRAEVRDDPWEGQDHHGSQEEGEEGRPDHSRDRPDREGEAIAYHVAEQLGYEKDRSRFQRVTFREITKGAVQEALKHPGPST